MLTGAEFDLVAKTSFVWIFLIWTGLVFWELVDTYRRLCEDVEQGWEDARQEAPDAKICGREGRR